MEYLLDELLSGTREVVWSSTDDQFVVDIEERPAGLLCGAFNPLHDGHRELRTVAERLLAGTVGYELSAHNVDKPSLPHGEMLARCRQFEKAVLAITAAPTFVQKASLLPETTFVVGIDTAVRIIDPRFYEASTAQMHNALSTIRDQSCRFLVAGRVIGGKFATLSDIELPAAFADLFVEIAETDFRSDLSSTGLRRN
jgi:Cytidylyltransferase-like